MSYFRSLSRQVAFCFVAGGLLAAWWSTPAPAQTITDSYQFATFNQSIWGNGSATWSAGGSVGTSWDQGGSAGSISNPSACLPIIGCFPLGSYGGTVNAHTSGNFGLGYSASATGGTVDLSTSMTSSLAIGPTYRQGNKPFTVSASGAVNSNSRLQLNVPAFKAAITANMGLEADVGGTACVGGCVSASATLVNFSKSFNILSVDTTTSSGSSGSVFSAGPVSVLGIPLTLPGFNSPYAIQTGAGASVPLSLAALQGKPFDPSNSRKLGIGGPTVATIEIDTPTTGSGTPTIVGPSTLQVSASNRIVRVGVDPIGVAQAAAGLPVNVVNPSISLGILSGSVTTVDVNAGLNLGLSQVITIDIPEILELDFSQPVLTSYSDGTTAPASNSVILGINNPRYPSTATINWAGQPGWLVSRTYAADDATLINDTGLSVSGDLQITAGCFALTLIDVLQWSPPCLLDQDLPTPEAIIHLATDLTTLALGRQTFYFDLPTATIPEPGTSVLLGSVASLFFVARRAGDRRRRGARADGAVDNPSCGRSLRSPLSRRWKCGTVPARSH